MRYFGSKVTLREAIYKIIKDRVSSGSLCDPFGGIGTVGSFMRSKGYEVWSGDLLTFAHYFQISKIKYPNNAAFQKILSSLSSDNIDEITHYLNSLNPCEGWFVSEYSIKRYFFTYKNATKIQACRNEIDLWEQHGLINYDEKAILIAGLIGSMDKVANTAGTYYAYLKHWHRKALKDFKFEMIVPKKHGSNGYCHLGPAEELIARQPYDIIYLDPPYNERSYAHYYHLPETIANGSCPPVHGSSGIPNYKLISSPFNKKTQAKFSFTELIAKSKCKLLFFHYADNGLITQEEIEKILSCYKKLEMLCLDSKGYYTGNGTTRSKHKIYLATNE